MSVLSVIMSTCDLYQCVSFINQYSIYIPICRTQRHGIIEYFEEIEGEREGSETIDAGVGQCGENYNFKEI